MRRAGDQVFEHGTTTKLKVIIQCNLAIKEKLRKSGVDDVIPKTITASAAPTTRSRQRRNHAFAQQDYFGLLDRMQANLNMIFDAESNTDGVSSSTLSKGLKQVIEKKPGLFRMNMMGKRVNFSARSVITPDPCQDTSEIGVPKYFARKWSYPENVTPRNFAEMRRLVVNGPNIYPGANYVWANNQLIDLVRLSVLLSGLICWQTKLC